MKNKKIILIILLCILFFSCSKKDLIINSTKAYPYYKGSYYGLSIVITSKETKSTLPCKLTSPSGAFTWEFEAKKVTKDNTEVYICSDIAMPENVLLKTGNYKLIIYGDYNDIVESEVNVSYKPDYGQKIEEYPFYDSTKNLTYLEPANLVD